jgi:hypothetical protein
VSTLGAVLVIAQLATMAHATGDGPEGRVVAAPHAGYESGTTDIAVRMARRLEFGVVQALYYRSVPSERWFDVNRPTERRWRSGRFEEDPVETRRAREIYEEYQERLGRAGRRVGGALDLLVELHGHSRREVVNGRQVVIDVIELATTGFTDAELEAIQDDYEQIVRAALPRRSRVPLAIDELQPRYRYAGALMTFRLRATGASGSGSMRPSRTERALHFELPQSVRFSRSMRRAYADVLAEVIERHLERETAARGLAGGLTGRP